MQWARKKGTAPHHKAVPEIVSPLGIGIRESFSSSSGTFEKALGKLA